MRVFSCCLSAFLFMVMPSKAYWQQHVATNISVSLDDRNHMLRGYEKMVYTNNSPDTLIFIYLHLWPNAYKNDRTAYCEQQVQSGNTDFYFAAAEDRGYIDSLKFYVDDERADFFSDGPYIDIVNLQLPKPLLPGQSVTIETPFRVKIPKLFSRLGHNKQAYFISQWFPKPAVYDHKGWHPMPYLDQGEFYSEFGSYDISITLPENYILVATGNCRTAAEDGRMDSLARLPYPQDTLYKSSYPASSTGFKTVRFTEENIHDFAWFADKRWIVRQDTVSGPGSEGVTKIITAFLPKHQKEWSRAHVALKTTIDTYGSAVGKYPYATLKAVEGDMNAGGGMEYPTVTIIDKSVASILPAVLTHEAGHNWFYGMLGSNERMHPWMDEGINSFYEYKTNAGTGSSENLASRLEEAMYYQLAAVHEDQAAAGHSAAFSSAAYGADVYIKTAHLLEWLEAYMGKEDFRLAMQAYFDTWKFKHPYPEDLRAIMQAHSVKNLDWFFDAALYTTQKIDFKLTGVRTFGDSLQVTVKNKSDFAAPVAVSVVKSDGIAQQAWTVPFKGTVKISLKAGDNWDKVVLGAVAPEFKLANNEYRRTGLVHKGGLRLNPLLGLNRSEQNKIYLLPAAGYNVYDGAGLGLLLHNLGWPQYRFQFALAPLYSFNSKQLNGAGAIAYSWYPKTAFKEIRFQVNVKSFSQGTTQLNVPEPLFARYIKVAPSLEFVFQKSPASPVSGSLLLKQYTIQEQYFKYALNPLDSTYSPSSASGRNTYLLLRYEHKNKRTFHPFSYRAEAQLGERFVKLGVDANCRIDYDTKGKSFYLRAYAGKFITIKEGDNSRYLLNTTYSGVNDYLYDGIYFARNKNEGTGAQQISMQEGGFKIPTNLYANVLGRSDNWLLALNVKTDLPLGKLPLRVYADAVTFADASVLNPSGTKVAFNAGLELHLFEDVLSIYAPLLMSSDYKDYISSMYPKNKFLKSIAFSLNIQNFNLLRTHEQIFSLISQ
jgi:hypothetical protein